MYTTTSVAQFCSHLNQHLHLLCSLVDQDLRHVCFSALCFTRMSSSNGIDPVSLLHRMHLGKEGISWQEGRHGLQRRLEAESWQEGRHGVQRRLQAGSW
jgi:hypothetical protein